MQGVLQNTHKHWYCRSAFSCFRSLCTLVSIRRKLMIVFANNTPQQRFCQQQSTLNDFHPSQLLPGTLKTTLSKKWEPFRFSSTWFIRSVSVVWESNQPTSTLAQLTAPCANHLSQEWPSACASSRLQSFTDTVEAHHTQRLQQKQV